MLKKSNRATGRRKVSSFVESQLNQPFVFFAEPMRQCKERRCDTQPFVETVMLVESSYTTFDHAQSEREDHANTHCDERHDPRVIQQGLAQRPRRERALDIGQTDPVQHAAKHH